MIGNIYQNKRNGQITLTLKKRDLDKDFLKDNPKFMEIKSYKVINQKK